MNPLASLELIQPHLSPQRQLKFTSATRSPSLLPPEPGNSRNMLGLLVPYRRFSPQAVQPAQALPRTHPAPPGNTRSRTISPRERPDQSLHPQPNPDEGRDRSLDTAVRSGTPQETPGPLSNG